MENNIITTTTTAKMLEALGCPQRETIKHGDILHLLLEGLKEVDFRDKAELNEGDKLHKKHYSIITIEEILKSAQLHRWGICTKDGFIYLYNSAYWEVINRDDFTSFLGQAAEQMGVYKFDAKHHIFRQELFNQFIATANLPTPKVDKSKTLINLSNGTFEISETEQILREPSPQDFIKYQLNFDYDPEAECPIFDEFLNTVLPDKACQDVLAEFIGYIFTNSIKIEKALVLYGGGANGKSVFYEVITAMLGVENVCSYSLENITKPEGYQRAELANKLVNYASEINGKLESSIFKQLTSGEAVEARQIYGKPFMMHSYAKLIFNCNELPREVEQTTAYFRRFVIVPFNVTIPPERQDIHLANKIIESELSGVFNWVLRGLNRLLKNNKLTHSDLIDEQVNTYRKESDSVLMFLDDNRYIPSATRCSPLKSMYNYYTNYASENGYRSVSSRKFSDRLRSQNLVVERKSSGRIVWCEQVYSSEEVVPEKSRPF